MVAELAWNTGVAVICFLVWFYPMGLDRNAEWTNAVDVRSTLVFLDIWASFLFASTLAHALIAGAPSSEAASAIANIFGICVRITVSSNERETSVANDLPFSCMHSPVYWSRRVPSRSSGSSCTASTLSPT
jgi:hypothetical protein